MDLSNNLLESASDGLPRGWTETPLTQLVEVLESGSRPKGGVRGIGEGIPSIGGEHLDEEGGFRFDAVKYVPFRFFDGMRRGRIQTGDVLVANLFYVDLKPAEESSEKTKKPTEFSGKDGIDQLTPNEITTDHFFKVQRTKDGFRLSKHPQAKRLPKVVALEMAYDVRQGNPFKRYQPFDFELNKFPMVVKGKGLRATVLRPNAIQLDLEKADFTLMVTGFDPNRDLKIKTTTSLDNLR